MFALEHAIFCLKRDGAPAAEVADTESELALLQSHPALHDLSKHEDRIAQLWRQGDLAAVRACCAGWAEMPDTAHLVALPPHEDAPASAEPDRVTLH